MILEWRILEGIPELAAAAGDSIVLDTDRCRVEIVRVLPAEGLRILLPLLPRCELVSDDCSSTVAEAVARAVAVDAGVIFPAGKRRRAGRPSLRVVSGKER